MSTFLKTIQKEGRGGPFYSFNKDYHLVGPSTKVIIVGTITSPQGRGLNKDFYYMSPYNPMYRIIDAYFKSTNRTSNFVNNKKMGNIKAIINELNEKGPCARRSAPTRLCPRAAPKRGPYPCCCPPRQCARDIRALA